MVNKDTKLKNKVVHLLQNCGLDNVVIDVEVHLNWTGEKNDSNEYSDEKEIDVIASFFYRDKRIILFFECEDSKDARGIRKEYKSYHADIGAILEHPEAVRVLHSRDNKIKGRHFKNVEIIRACFCYGAGFSVGSYQSCLKVAKQHSFLVWNYFAVTYYATISSILRGWTRFELFRDFKLELEGTTQIRINALQIRQKKHLMYLGTIHPGQLLRIAYVVRRASTKTYAYQRLLNGDRIRAIANFVSSQAEQAFLPNAIIAVFDEDPKVQHNIHYDPVKKELTIPLMYCSAWIIDGQHRAFGFVGTDFEDWEEDDYKTFDLPVIFFRTLSHVVQTETFININYFQNRIKPALLCDLTTLTKDLGHKLTWPSLLSEELDQNSSSKLKGLVKISELHHGRPISLASLVSFGLLETLLGYRGPKVPYNGPLYTFAPFNSAAKFESKGNRKAFREQVDLLIRFFDGVYANTTKPDERRDPWKNTRRYSLLKTTGLNSLFLVLARILKAYPDGGVDLKAFLKPLRKVVFRNEYVTEMGGGWKGFRKFANVMIRRLNDGNGVNLDLYGKHGKT